jgi:epoxyqueuosine reductase QueG
MSMKLDEHPTVKRYRETFAAGTPANPSIMDAAWLRQTCLECGADDAAAVSLGQPELASHRQGMLALLPGARSAVSLVVRLNPESVRCVSRAASDLEFLQAVKQVDQTARACVTRMRARGVRALNVAGGFPMDVDQWPNRMWSVPHKTVAEAAGMGRIGHHRLLVHPRFGAFVTLGTVLIDAEVSAYGKPIDHDPCLDCKLCVAVCPVGAVTPDGAFKFSNCITHNYRDRVGGFSDWVDAVVTSSSPAQYRKKVSDPETLSMWQALSFGVSNKCSYCMAVCPAGEDVIGPFLRSRKAFNATVVQPLRERVETVYVVAGSDGEAHVSHRFPHKKVKRVGSGIRPDSVRGFLGALPHVFNRDQAKGLSATFHFTFQGEENCRATIVIRDSSLQVLEDHVGEPDVRVTADSRTWLRFLAKEQGIASAMITMGIRVKGSPRLMGAFGKCFPL